MTEDLGIKVGTKKEDAWTRVLEASKDLIIQSEIEIEIRKLIVDLAEKKIELEKYL